MMNLAGGELLSEKRGPIQWLTFNRPEARNALTWAMYDGLVDECARINRDRSVRALVAGFMTYLSQNDARTCFGLL